MPHCQGGQDVQGGSRVGQSPELNPIENAWADLERRLRACSVAPKPKDELFAALQEEWTAKPDAYFKKLTESMCRRVRGVVAANGAGTKYLCVYFS